MSLRIERGTTTAVAYVTRSMRCVAIAILAIVVLSNSVRASDTSDCYQTTDYDLAIRACTARLRSLDSMFVGPLFTNGPKAEAYLGRGNAYHRKGQYDRAISDYSEAIVLYPNHVPYLFNRGFTYLRNGDAARAIVDLDRVLSLDPSYHQAYEVRANAHLKLGSLHRALEDAERGIRLSPGLAGMLETRGKILAAVGRVEEAVIDFRKALSIDPSLQTSREAIRRLGFEP